VSSLRRSSLPGVCVVDIDYMFLVGGFAESQVLQLELRREFGHLLKVIIPQDVSLTILKGNDRNQLTTGVIRSHLMYSCNCFYGGCALFDVPQCLIFRSFSDATI